MTKPALRYATAAMLALLCAGAQANTFSVQWQDLAGDGRPVGDVIAVRLMFSDSGAWTASWQAGALLPVSDPPSYLANLHAADGISSNFISGALSQPYPVGRDQPLTQARVTSHVPEPSSVLLTAMALALAGLTGTSLSLLRHRPKPQPR